MDLQELLNLLPPTHRDQFLSLVSDPDSEQVQRLLGSLEEVERKDLEGGSVPWFMIKEDREEEQEAEDVDKDDDAPNVRELTKPRPALDCVTRGLKVDPAVGVNLLYNTFAIWYVESTHPFSAHR
jgi:hypothetical protein